MKEISMQKLDRDIDLSLLALQRYYGSAPVISGLDITNCSSKDVENLLNHLCIFSILLSEIQNEDNYCRFKQAYQEAETIFEATDVFDMEKKS